jgi:hypothetical protein
VVLHVRTICELERGVEGCGHGLISGTILSLDGYD